MEDVLEVYQRPYDPLHPVICMDEKPYQLLDDVSPPQPVKEGTPRREDNEYERKGTCCLFAFVEPLTGWQYISASPRRTMLDWAREIKHVLTECFQGAEKVLLIADNLNTHFIKSLYEAFPAAEALSLAKRLEIHYTPKKGSWLNIAEIELSILSRQCLDRRIASLERLSAEIYSWQTERNLNPTPVRWQFTTDEARIKLHSLYPKL